MFWLLFLPTIAPTKFPFDSTFPATYTSSIWVCLLPSTAVESPVRIPTLLVPVILLPSAMIIANLFIVTLPPTAPKKPTFSESILIQIFSIACPLPSKFPVKGVADVPIGCQPVSGEFVSIHVDKSISASNL